MATSDDRGGADAIVANSDERSHARRETFVRGGDGDIPDLDTVFRLLADQRRRMIFQLLRARPEACADLREVAEFVHGWEHELGKSTPSNPKSIEIALRHKHLPVLTEANAVEHDQSTDTIHYRASDRLERFIDLAVEESVIP